MRRTGLVLGLGDGEGRALRVEHPERGETVDVVAYPLVPDPEENLDLLKGWCSRPPDETEVPWAPIAD
ncbi:hypothetical protein N4G69_47045 [Streptomyces mirabilis]|uniref:hypothetical protein n=1 Tax=Streptomyces mirabilis TaxID=68239 RepID=UPI0021BF1E8F|nr:hypothetical protein [Streptomyces mirabilis]MCT9113000.1 hypothetical protein [Streptomyces mirabilis]